MRFILAIKLGNAEMQTAGDVAEALREVADKIDNRRGGDSESGTIRDANGNRVGRYEMTEED